MVGLSTDELAVVSEELERAIPAHEQWFHRLVRALTYAVPTDTRELAADAHTRCAFGQWYHGTASEMVRTLPAFVALGLEHERVHRDVAMLHEHARLHADITPAAHDIVVHALDRMRLHVQALQRQLADMRYHRDPLTGAHSRMGLLPTLRENHALVRRGVTSCTIAMMDIDHFREVNQRYGHRTGDRVLASSVAHVMQHVRTFDKVFRYGGEEFVLCLPGLGQEQAFALTEQLRLGIAGVTVPHDTDQVRITVSFGVTSMDPDATVEDCLGRSDRAVFHAKTGGCNCSRAWAP
jgi:diguanylate cyclase (GGDEF)-like protein